MTGSFLGESDDGANLSSSRIDRECVKKEEKGGFVLDAERDVSGSVMGFHLIPSSGAVEVAEPPEDAISDEAEEAEDIDEKEEPETRTTYDIVFVSAEAAPYSKTGGLGDVCGSLPIVLASRGHRVMVVSPRYLNGTTADKNFASVVDTECRIKVPCFGGEQEVAFFHEYREGVDWVFVDHPAYHRPGNPYGDCYGAFGDNHHVKPHWSFYWEVTPMGKNVCSSSMTGMQDLFQCFWGPNIVHVEFTRMPEVFLEWSLQQHTKIWDYLQSGVEHWDGFFQHGQGPMLLTHMKLLTF